MYRSFCRVGLYKGALLLVRFGALQDLGTRQITIEVGDRATCSFLSLARDVSLPRFTSTW